MAGGVPLQSATRSESRDQDRNPFPGATPPSVREQQSQRSPSALHHLITDVLVRTGGEGSGRAARAGRSLRRCGREGLSSRESRSECVCNVMHSDMCISKRKFSIQMLPNICYIK